MYMAFFSSAITTLKTLVVAIGAGLGVWGVVNLLEGYGNDNPGAKSQGMKQLPIPRAIEVLAARVIGKDIRRFHAIGAQRIQLPIQILITRAHPRIPVHRCHLIPAFS